jgi:hypothetical protein
MVIVSSTILTQTRRRLSTFLGPCNCNIIAWSVRNSSLSPTYIFIRSLHDIKLYFVYFNKFVSFSQRVPGSRAAAAEPHLRKIGRFVNKGQIKNNIRCVFEAARPTVSFPTFWPFADRLPLRPWGQGCTIIPKARWDPTKVPVTAVLIAGPLSGNNSCRARRPGEFCRHYGHRIGHDQPSSAIPQFWSIRSTPLRLSANVAGTFSPENPHELPGSAPTNPRITLTAAAGSKRLLDPFDGKLSFILHSTMAFIPRSYRSLSSSIGRADSVTAISCRSPNRQDATRVIKWLGGRFF